MFLEADDALFRRILYNKTHVLHTCLPERPQVAYSLLTKTYNKSHLQNLLSGLCIKTVIDYSSTSCCSYIYVCLHVYMYVLYVTVITCACQCDSIKKLDDDDDEAHLALSGSPRHA